jgi:UTP--glucose-1-phosphate uridylyltransferase
MIEIHEQYGGAVLSLFTSPLEEISAFGVAAIKDLAADTVQVTHLVEKPAPQEAPSDQAIAGRYVLTPDIFELLEQTPPGKGGEIQITDALEILARSGQCYGLRFDGIRYDTGTPLGLVITNIAYALKRPDLAPALLEYMRKVVSES